MEVGMRWRVDDTKQSIPERFEGQARRHRDKVAIAGTSWTPSFEELDAAANGLAHTVLERDGGDEGRAALLLRHDAPLIAAVLGALKANKTVMTLNPADPPARLERIRTSAGAQVVLCDDRHRELALRAGFAPDRLIGVPERPDGDGRASPAVTIDPDRTAFLVQTSGSTGDPKGVMQPHRNMLHNVLRQTNRLGVRSEDRLTLLASPSGAQGVAMLWVGLLNGATLCPFPVMERGVTGLVPWLDEHGVTVLGMSASLFRNFVRTLDGERLPNIRLLRMGSEPALRDDFDAFRRHLPPGCVLANMYASSETGNVAGCLLTADADPADGPLPVGRPTEGIAVRVLDEHGERVPPGRVGEIVVAGEYLSPGYWGDPALTAERFDDAGSNGGRLFRTGDLGWVSDEGVLTVVGRSDSQVNVRGYRVELAEVEGSLAEMPGVAEAAVCARTAPGGDVKLAGYVTTRPGSEISTASLRRGLRAVLPDPAVPSTFEVLESMPLGPHGKVDRRRLAEIEPPPTGPARPLSSPASGIEELLAAIWARAFELDRVDPNDDFFELGGDSLTATVIAAELHGALGVEVELGTFAKASTVASMARLVDRMQPDADEDERPSLDGVPRVERPPASFYQEGVWRTSRTPEESVAHTVAIAYRLQGPLDIAALSLGVDHLVRRHEALRTTFEERDGRLVQVIHPHTPIDLPLIELSDSPDPSAEADELLEREARIPFDLERGPLLRLWLVRLADDEHRLLRISHHIVSDAFSWELFFNELGPVYGAYRGGGSPPSDDPPLQLGAFATWERRCHQPDSRRHRAEVEWWRPVLDPDLPALPLPGVRPSIDPGAPASDGVIWWGLPPDVSDRLARLAAASGGTYYMVRFALFAAHLASETGCDEVALLTTMSKRRLPQLQGMFGPCLDTRPLRIRIIPEETLSQWLRRIRSLVVDASAHSEIPLPELSEELGVGGPPRIQAMFAESRTLDRARVGDLEITSLRHVFGSTVTGMSIWVNRRQEADGCYVRFDQRFFEPSAIRSFIARYQRLAARAHGYADRPVGELVRPAADSVSSPWRARLSRLLRS
jgi:amino acid adenylation domain-containing protein